MKKILKLLFVFAFLIFLLGSLGLNADAVVTATVSSGSNPHATLTGGVRYKSFNSGSDREIYLGIPDLGVGSNRVEKDAVWQSSNHILFTYDPIAGNETTSVNTGGTIYNLTYPAAGTLDLGNLNYVQIDVVNRAAGTTVNFTNVILNGVPLGNFIGVGWSTWMVTGMDLTTGFTIEGDIVLSGTQPGSSELNKVEIKVGYAVPLEITTSTLSGGIVLVPYSQTLAASGGMLPYTWSVSSGNLPNGLTLDVATGEISGVPSVSGAFGFTVLVTDASSATAVRNLSITTESMPVRFGDPGAPVNYDHIIQSAYDQCVDGYIIQVQGLEFSGDVICDHPVSISLQGGFNENYTEILGHTTILGMVVIRDGSVVVNNITIR